MEFQIVDKTKKDIFVAIFSLLKNASSQINFTMTDKLFYIQGMDKSHICLFELKILPSWFYYYKIDSTYNICVDTNIFHSAINIKNDDQIMCVKYSNDNGDVLSIEHIGVDSSDKKREYNKYFTIPLKDNEYVILNIPNSEYDADLSLPAKNFTDILSQLSNFGQDLVIHCTDRCVDILTKGDTAEMRVNIPIDDLDGYSIVEGEEVKLSYNMTYISKMCISNKLSTNIDLHLSNETPMKIEYDLGDNSTLVLFIAPKTLDD
jgi:proliferating cell nuclear antigen